MNKIIITMICVIVVLVGGIFAVIVFSPNEKQEENIIEEAKELNNTKQNTSITENTINKVNTLETNSSEEEKISPNCEMIKKIYYKECEHTTTSYNNVEEKFVNMTKNELEEELPDWKIEEFSENRIVLYQEKDGECNEHYIVRDKDGQVVIYQKTEDGEKEIEVTDISTEYLPETDKIQMENGIEVNGKQALNQLIEDYE